MQKIGVMRVWGTKGFWVFLSVSLFVSCTPNPQVYSIARSSSKEGVHSKSLGDLASEKIDEMGLKKWTSENYNRFASEKDYIQEFAEVAMKEMKLYGIPASITLAQGILETNAGKSQLVKNSNNHFGIKCHKDWKGPSVSYDDDAVGECFRQYHHPISSFRDHSKFLSERDRYKFLFQFEPTDYKAWAIGLKEAGYATDKKYPDKLIAIVERNGLDAFDRQALTQRKRAVRRANRKDKVVSALTGAKDAIANIGKRTKEMADEAQSNIENTYRGLAHRVSKGDTLYSIAKKYEVSIEDIKKLNLLDSERLSIGQILEIPKIK